MAAGPALASEKGELMDLLGGEERCEAEVGQMVADNEGVKVWGGQESCCSQATAQRQTLHTPLRTSLGEGGAAAEAGQRGR